MTVAREVLELAEQHGVVDRNGYPEWLADQLCRIEGIEGDETMELIAALGRDGILTSLEMTDLTLQHSREQRK
ncbi:hypothetical protein ACCS66_04200 [Rhizobium ruizarguesonis]